MIHVSAATAMNANFGVPYRIILQLSLSGHCITMKRANLCHMESQILKIGHINLQVDVSS
jgi:hypothetical protein